MSDAPPGKPGWQIEIGLLPKAVFLSNLAVSTSGDTFQHLEVDGVRYSHIVDPRTGMGITNHLLVSVVASTSTKADALATAISVVGREKGSALAKRFGSAVYYGDTSR